MAHSSRVCPHCGALNGAGETRCYRCGKAFPGPLVRGVVDLYYSLLGRELQLTKFFIGLCAVVFVFTTLDAHKFEILGSYARSVELRFGGLLVPLGHHGLLVCRSNGACHLGPAEPWRYLSACFFHFGLLHIGLNMWVMWDLGRAIEPRFGSARFCIIFVVTGVAGFAATGAWYGMHQLMTGGASGGIFGLFGAFIGYLYAKRDPIWKRFVVEIVIYTVIFSLAMPLNNVAHAVGGISGLPFGYLFYKEARPWRRNKLLGWIAGVMVVASVGSLVMAQRSPYWTMVRRDEIKRGMPY